MHTLETTIVITTILMCIFGCIFLELEMFERVIVQREICIKTEEAEREVKEPYCNKKNGFMKLGDEGRNFYHPLKSIVNAKVRSFDPMEKIRMTDQGIELLLELKREN